MDDYRKWLASRTEVPPEERSLEELTPHLVETCRKHWAELNSTPEGRDLIDFMRRQKDGRLTEDEKAFFQRIDEEADRRIAEKKRACESSPSGA